MVSVKIHFGCGQSKFPGHIGVDILPIPGVDILCDLGKPIWPLKDSCADECVLRNILEHLNSTILALEEVWRITKKWGLVHIAVPYYNSPGAFQDPTHVRFFTERSFDYFTPDNHRELSRYNYYTHARFEIIKLELNQRGFLRRLPWRWQVFLAHHFSTAYGIEVTLKVLK